MAETIPCPCGGTADVNFDGTSIFCEQCGLYLFSKGFSRMDIKQRWFDMTEAEERRNEKRMEERKHANY